MDLIISGMALSFQWCGSLKQFEENLIDKGSTNPALVEHAGEVIYQALENAGVGNSDRLTIFRDSSQVELGHYLPLLEQDFGLINQLSPASSQLPQWIKQAGELIHNGGQDHVLLLENSQSGSAAVVLSSLKKAAPNSIIIRSFPASASAHSSVDYLEISGAYQPASQAAAQILTEVFQDRVGEHPIAVGSIDVPGPQTPEIINLIQAATAIRLNTIPKSDRKSSVFPPDLKQDPFYINLEHRPWLSRRGDFTRSALLICGKSDGPEVIFQLEEIIQPAAPIRLRIVNTSDPYLFPLSAPTETELLDRLGKIEGLLGKPGSLKSLAYTVYTKYFQKTEPYICCLIGKNREELFKEVHHARSGIQETFRTGVNWSSPQGSYFTANPLGSEKIAFVYPGAFNSYPGMGRELFFSFPGLQQAAQELIPDLSHSLAEDFLFLRTSKGDPAPNPDQVMADFYNHPNELIESGISLSVIYTLILEQIFGIKPDTALGYSLGEISMLWANKIWQNPQEISISWKESLLFKNQLAGQMLAVRSYWSDQDLPEDFWSSFILKADRGEVQSACDREPLAFLTIQNTDDEVVISGEKQACQRVIKDLDCHALPMPFNTVIHNPTMESSFPAFVDLYTNQINAQSGISFFSAADYRELNLQVESLADSMARMTCKPVDFPKLVDRVYADGARIFIEMGPQKTCSRWIEKILAGKPHAVIPINKKYQPDLHGILKVISLLLSHGVELELQALFPIQELPPAEQTSEILVPGERVPPDRSSIPLSIKGSLEPHPILSQPRGAELDYFDHLDRISADLASGHQQYLDQQQSLTKNLAKMIGLQAITLQDQPTDYSNPEVLYTHRQIQAFTRGDHRQCFGETFSGFGDRRIPRLPNGDLQFIDRVISIQGSAGQVREGSSLVSEFDLDFDSWYGNGRSQNLPHVAIMELALQPCGFLSAYLGSIKGREAQDLYFRNLDGEGLLLNWPENPGNLIRNKVELLSSSSLEDVIIQNYSFELSWGKEPFYRGRSSFGYFPLPMLQNQVGLDANQQILSWYRENPEAGEWSSLTPSPRSRSLNGTASLPIVDRIWISRQGGDHGRGYLFLEQAVPIDAWFYQAHFYQDPVMPGSLGVEIMAQALRSAADTWGVPPGKDWRIQTRFVPQLEISGANHSRG